MGRFFSLIFLIILSPLFLVIFLFIYLFIDKKIFFVQKRIGFNGQTFDCYKFASMINNTTELGNKSANLEDHRVNKIGAFLRRNFLDELPQLINVILGDMNFVGPRPHSVYEDLKFAKKIISYKKRYLIKPGITGYAQVKGCTGPIINENQLKKRVAYDIVYINNVSFLLNLYILYQTLLVFIKKLFNIYAK
jgi:lipopolysaccharide/colanic/teichoic acid biosynthesis glycosyltransferase